MMVQSCCDSGSSDMTLSLFPPRLEVSCQPNSLLVLLTSPGSRLSDFKCVVILTDFGMRKITRVA